MEFVTNDVCTEDQRSKKGDEDEQAPSRPQSVLPRKILWRADGCVGIIGIIDAGETGSVGISAASLSKGTMPRGTGLS
jgi:hypothetical protein